MNKKNYFYFCLVVFLNGCATFSTHHQYWQPYANQSLNFSGSGRLSVKIDNRGSHGNFDWDNRSSNQLNIININTPIGNTIGQLCKDAQGVVAKNNKGEIFTGQNSAELSEKLLGFPVPIDYLDFWVNGYIPTQLSYQVSGNQLIQDGWRIERVLTKNQTTRILTLQRKNLSMTVVFDDLTKTKSNNSVRQLCPDR